MVPGHLVMCGADATSASLSCLATADHSTTIRTQRCVHSLLHHCSHFTASRLRLSAASSPHHCALRSGPRRFQQRVGWRSYRVSPQPANAVCRNATGRESDHSQSRVAATLPLSSRQSCISVRHREESGMPCRRDISIVRLRSLGTSHLMPL